MWHIGRGAALVACMLALMATSVAARTGTGEVVVRLNQPDRPLILFWSGDGGWHGDIDARLGAELSERGFDVVGLDTNIWFADKRSATEAGRKLSDMIARYGRTTPGRRIILMGWSFGADSLPFAYNALSEGDKAAVSQIVLLAVSKSTNLQVTLASRTGLDPGSIAVPPELARLPRDRLTCVYNTHDSQSSGCL
ncbi:MAG: AcvB/VirJ family lysyl-phosphatidylglycerol hydrolase, partial [Asticcacaulis sp.]